MNFDPNIEYFSEVSWYSLCHTFDCTSTDISSVLALEFENLLDTLVLRFDADLSNKRLIGRSVSHPPHVVSSYLIAGCIVLRQQLELSCWHNDVYLNFNYSFYLINRSKDEEEITKMRKK